MLVLLGSSGSRTGSGCEGGETMEKRGGDGVFWRGGRGWWLDGWMDMPFHDD